MALQDVTHPPGDFTGPYPSAVLASVSASANCPGTVAPTSGTTAVDSDGAVAPASGTTAADASAPITSAGTVAAAPSPTSPPPLPPPPAPPPGYHTAPPRGHLSSPPTLPPFPPLPPNHTPVVVPPPRNQASLSTTHAASASDSSTPKTTNVFSKAASQLTGFLSGHVQQAGAIVAANPPSSCGLGAPDSSVVLDDLTDPNTGKASSDTYPEQLPGKALWLTVFASLTQFH